MRHFFRKVQRPFVEKTVDRAVHPANDDTFLEVDETQWLRGNVELYSGQFFVFDQISEAITTRDEDLRIDVVAAMCLNENWDCRQIVFLGNIHAGLAEHQKLTVLSTEQNQPLLLLILQAFIDFTNASDEVTVRERGTSSNIRTNKEIVLLSNELCLFGLILQRKKARRHFRKRLTSSQLQQFLNKLRPSRQVRFLT